MLRKFSLTTAMMLGVALAVSGLGMAADESPLEKQMSQVGKHTNAIKKATNTVANWQKLRKDVPEKAAAIAKLGKEARADKGPSEKQKKPFAEWTKYMDDMIKSAEELETLAKKADSSQEKAKAAYTALNKSCASCHSVFKVDEDK